MKNIQQKVLKFIDRQLVIPPGSRVLVACSGGVDSMALLHFLATHRKSLGIEVGAIHIDHMLRGRESAEDAHVVERLCCKFQLPFFSERVAIPAILESRGGNVQMLCREERYKCFERMMQHHQFTILATAHHAEDQLETVLIQLSKGHSLNGMPMQRAFSQGSVVRPFLPLKKSELYTYADYYRLPFREDPSNQQGDYLRNRLRHQVVPVLTQENPSIASSTVRQTAQRQADEELLRELAKQHLQVIISYTDEQLPTFDRGAFLAIPYALQKRVIQLVLKCHTSQETEKFEQYSSIAEELLQHIQNSAGNIAIDLSNGYQFVREYDRLLVTKKDNKITTYCPKQLEKGIWYTWGSVQFYWQQVDAHVIDYDSSIDEIMYFQLPSDELPLTVRLRQPGDRIRLKGMSQAKRVSRLLIDEKIGMAQRKQQPVVTTSNGIVCAIPGVRYGEIFSHRQVEGDSYIWITRKSENR